MVQILTIDDDPIIQMILRRTLQEQGYEVIAAESGEEGLLRVQQYNPALVLCDWQMSGKDGLEVCRQIKSDPNRASTFFILLTARTAAADRMAGLDAGADEFLAKPIEVNELKATVKAGLRMHQSAQALQKLTADLETQKQRLEIELAGAAEYVRSLLPAPLTGAITIDWRFLPAQTLGGDYFDYFWLDSDCLVVYLLDISDHCFKSVLASVSIHHLLRSHSLPNTNLYQPQTVLTALKDVFQMGNPDERYFTIWYGIYNQATRQLDYASAGHPPAVLVSETEVQQLTAREIPIGLFTNVQCSDRCWIPSGSTLYLFSNGLCKTRSSESWNLNSLVALIHDCHQQKNCDIEQIFQQVHPVKNFEPFENDCSLLQLCFH